MRIEQIIAGVLDLDYIEPNQNLLDLGADSLDLVTIVGLLEREIGFRPKIADLYHVEQKGHTFPRTPAEDLIAGIYASNLNVAPLGVYDNLPSLGFTPHVAAPVKLRLQQIFQVDVPIDCLLLHTTIDSRLVAMSGKSVTY